MGLRAQSALSKAHETRVGGPPPSGRALRPKRGAPHPAGTVAERIRAVRNELASAELAVANRLIGRYPTAGLVPIVQLAAAANVVIRHAILTPLGRGIGVQN
jgi:hypothetical protein